eukprot:7506705-Pyramimonas_sp.AAC.1
MWRQDRSITRAKRDVASGPFDRTGEARCGVRTVRSQRALIKALEPGLNDQEDFLFERFYQPAHLSQRKHAKVQLIGDLRIIMATCLTHTRAYYTCVEPTLNRAVVVVTQA